MKNRSADWCSLGNKSFSDVYKEYSKSTSLYIPLWQKYNISPTVHNKHAVGYDTQKRKPMSGVSNGLWTIKLTGSSVLPITPCIPQDSSAGLLSSSYKKRGQKSSSGFMQARRFRMMMTNSGALGLDSPCWPCCSRGTRSSRVTRVT